MPITLDAIYTGAAVVAAPYVLGRMAASERWRAGLAQRLGFVEPRRGPEPCLWVHCASVGEALNVNRFLEAMRGALPDWRLVVSTNTNTGMAVAHKRYPDLQAFYYPLDFSWAVERTMQRIRPAGVVLFELEAWPHLLIQAARSRVPVAVINGRVNPHTVCAHRLLRLLAGDFFARGALNAYGVQSEDYAARFAQLGIPQRQIHLTGNVKYDNIRLEPDASATRRLAELFEIEPDDLVLVGGSTWEGEEAALLRAFGALRSEFPRLRLILAPRHVERAGSVAGQVERAGRAVVRKTALDAGRRPDKPLRDAVILVDTVGDLGTVYGLAAAAFVGRSLAAPGGGQNMLEPAALGRPVLFGPHTSNFVKETKLLLQRRAALRVNDAAEMADSLRSLLRSPADAAAMGERARQTIVENMGAVERSVALVLDVLKRGRIWRDE